jgi:methyl-accepting chemotaxis protein
MHQTRFMHSLAGRMFLFGVLPAILTMAAIVAVAALNGYRTALETQRHVLAADVLAAASEIGARNDRWNAIAQILAASQTEGLFGKRAETLRFLREVNRTSDGNLSAFIVYEPDADGKDAESLKLGTLPAESMDASGRFLPVWFDEYVNGVRTGKDGLKPSVGMEDLEYYTGPRDDFRSTGKPHVLVTEPYVREGQRLVGHVMPIVIDGKFKGVAGVNRSLEIITSIAASIRRRSQADVFILSPRGQFIAATEDEGKPAGVTITDRDIKQTPYAPFAAQWLTGIPVGEETNSRAVDPVLGEECLYAVTSTPVGGWTVVTRRPVSEVMQATTSAIRRNVLLGSGGVVLIGALMYVVTTRIAKRVRSAADAADRIARGDLTAPVPESESLDESGQLMRSMSTMDGNLNALVGNVKQAGIRLNSTATQIAATSRQQEASSATFGAASNQIAAAVKEISATSRDLVKTMDSVNQIAGETAMLAGSGQASLQNMELVMHDLDGATGSIADKLTAIRDRSQKITSVITTITKVADQTNILSINAAIEAEKAGEYGSGFLVIAREIRRLADQTAGATLDIEQMVQQMQGAVSSGVMEMDRFADQVRRGVREVAAASAHLTQIIERVNRSTESFKQVNDAMQAQSEGAQQISDAMSSLVGNANQTVQAVKEFSHAAADLQSAISLLRDAVAKFKLRE